MRWEEGGSDVSEGSSEYYVRFQLQLGDGDWESVAFGPTDEADARRFYKRLEKAENENMRQPRLLRHGYTRVEPD